MMRVNLVRFVAVIAWFLSSSSSSSSSSSLVVLAEEDNSSDILRCPTDDKALLVPIDDGGAATVTVSIRVSQVGEVCLLAQVRVNDAESVDASDDSSWTSYVPVARSYDGYQWERSAGRLVEEVSVTCNRGDNWCRVTFPATSSSKTYHVLWRAQNFISQRDQVARFLIQATFGPTRAEIDAFNVNNDDEDSLSEQFAEWIKDQMDYQPTSLHRSYWRFNTNPAFIQSRRKFAPIHPCSAGSRWRRYALKPNVDVGKFLTIASHDENHFALTVNNHLRTILPNTDYRFFNPQTPQHYQICSISADGTGIRVRQLESAGTISGENTIDSMTEDDCFLWPFGNPPISFPQGQTPEDFLTMNENMVLPVALDPTSEEFILQASIRKKPDRSNTRVCDSLSVIPDDPDAMVHAQIPQIGWVVHDPHNNMLRNTLEQPLADGGGQLRFETDGELGCANVPRTFLNQDTCFLSNERSVCVSRSRFEADLDDDGSFSILPTTDDGTNATLDHDFLRDLFVTHGRYVYAVDGLRLEDSPLVPSPCGVGVKSRWRRIPNVDEAACHAFNDPPLHPNTIKALASLLRSKTDGEEDDRLLQDLRFLPDRRCYDGDLQRRGMQVFVNGICWHHVHPHYRSVFDFTKFSQGRRHPGNQAYEDTDEPNPIQRPALVDKSTILEFPTHHAMADWESKVLDLTYVGKLGDPLTPAMVASVIGWRNVLDSDIAAEADVGRTMVCGSPGEVENRRDIRDTPSASYEVFGNKEITDVRLQRHSVFASLLLNESTTDQLRQRVAWALTQIIPISPITIGFKGSPEAFLTYHDIFVRNAFSNYKDVLREISYSPLMGQSLTYVGSKSSDYIYRQLNIVAYADENFAREIMQLFTIGLVQLNIDGTHVRNKRGKTIATYNNDNILSFARVWTGFDRQQKRPNIERYVPNNINGIDPMAIIPQWRDKFPKMNLYDGFIGDRYPLCVDLPERAFLRQGARYRLLGSLGLPELLGDPIEWKFNTTSLKRFILEEESKLYGKLCSRTKRNKCRFRNEVVLDSNLSCYGSECDVDDVRVVQVAPDIFYEYVRVPCVELSFYENPTAIGRWGSSSFMCADPRTVVASEACCGGTNNQVSRSCIYSGERTTLAKAQGRCDELCNVESQYDFSLTADDDCRRHRGYFWTRDSCTIRIKVSDDGMISIIHKPDNDDVQVEHHVDAGSVSYFAVPWEEGKYPTVKTGCGGGACREIGQDCLCDVAIEEKTVFSNEWPSIEELLSQLFIGAFPPSMFDIEFQETTNEDASVHAYGKSTSDNDFDMETIFKVEDSLRRTFYLRNLRSDVVVVDQTGAATSFQFRNPPHFVNFADANARDSIYETDAAIDHYFHHDNVAPFVAYRLIQRFGISNPSPSYVERVATAFRRGNYRLEGTDQRIVFGSREYGDLKATIAAVLLDREARSVVLDADPSFGSLREPLLKAMALFRSMEFHATDPTRARIDLADMDLKIGQMAHEPPSVFSFFSPDHIPAGPLTRAGLVAPESQILNGPTIFGILNGMFSVSKWGLTHCASGFAEIDRSQNLDCDSLAEGDFSQSKGYLGYRPKDASDSAAVVQELSTILTGGRLNPEALQTIREQYEAEEDDKKALLVAQQLVVSSPEFHSTGVVRKSGNAREDSERSNQEATSSSDVGYKAIVFFNQMGGADSFNLLVPHSNCGKRDFYAEYKDIRGPVALEKEKLLPINADRTKQPCKTFGVHPSLPLVRDLYSEGDLLFVANAGSLSRPVTKANYSLKTRAQLFAHNSMQDEATRVDPYLETIGTGILGRVAGVLSKRGFRARAISVEESSPSTIGIAPAGPSEQVIRRGGIATLFDPRPSTDRIRGVVAKLNAADKATSSLYGNHWSENVHRALEDNLGDALENTTLPLSGTVFKADDIISDRFKSIAKAIAAREKRGANRDVFHVSQQSYDFHGDDDGLKENYQLANDALKAFVRTVKSMGLWDDVVIVQMSEFSRTLTPNTGNGTDHGWGGNYWIAGGQVDGGKILGRYPSDLSVESKWNIGRGRMLPTTPFDAMWNGVAEWFGVTDPNDLDEVLPNRFRFVKKGLLLSRLDIFENQETD